MPPPRMEASEVFMMLNIEKMSVGAVRLVIEESSRPYTRGSAISSEDILKFMLDEHKTCKMLETCLWHINFTWRSARLHNDLVSAPTPRMHCLYLYFQNRCINATNVA